MDGNVRIGALSILGKPARFRRDGLFVATGGLSGWFEGVAPRLVQQARPLEPGDFDVPVNLASRTIVVPGLAIAKSAAELLQHGARLTGLLAQGESEVMSVEHANLTTWANVRLGAATKFAPKRGGGTVADFQLTMWAPDPRRFGVGRRFASAANAYHYGNFPSAPVITVSGSMSGYTINGPYGRKYTVTAAVTSGNPHVIDMRTGGLTIDGVPVYGAVSEADTWAVPAGEGVLMTLAPLSGTGTMSAMVVDTYV